MSETKQESNLSLIWELALYIPLFNWASIFEWSLLFVSLILHMVSSISENNSVFWGQEFKGGEFLLYYFSLILLILYLL